MKAPTPTPADPLTIAAVLNYIVPMDGKPRYYTYEPMDGSPRENFRHDSRECQIHNARPLQKELSIERDGFSLLKHRSAVRDFSNEQEIRDLYYAEAEGLIRNSTGATRVVVFDHAIRKRPPGRPPLSFGRPPNYTTLEPVGRVHNDYTPDSAPRRAYKILGDEVDAVADARFCQFNLWRSITDPLLDTPLAICSAASILPSDLRASDIVYPARMGELYLATYNSAHRWYYYPRMRADEVLLFKGFDSAQDGTARFTLHSAFDDPTTPTDALPRQSVELRAFAFY